MTCHGAIVARELGIPAVVGAANATQVIQTGTLILVNGNEGKIYALKDAAAINRLTPTPGKALNQSLSVSSVMSQTQSDPIQTAPPAVAPEPQRSLATQLMVNLSQPNSIERAVGLPVDGVGLLRSELLAIEVLEHQHPDLWLQQGRQTEFVERMAAHIGEFARAFAPRPVFYRSLDLRSDEFQALEGGQEFLPESNPMLGLRGAFRYLLDPALFDLELAALVQVQESGYRNVHLMLPFVRQVEEFVFCRQRVERAGLTQHPEFQLWIMAEVPSILFLLPDYVKAGVQGVSIGTNDLTQLLLGVDRHQAQMASVFNERHPAVMQTIAQLIREAKQAGIPCSLCGQAPVSYPELIDQFVRWGITSISVNPGAVEQTYSAIARAEQRIILEAARLQLEP
jgi:pyruvate,water dikinase